MNYVPLFFLILKLVLIRLDQFKMNKKIKLNSLLKFKSNLYRNHSFLSFSCKPTKGCICQLFLLIICFIKIESQYKIQFKN